MALPQLSENADANELGEALKSSISAVIQLRSRSELSDDERSELTEHARFVTQLDPIHAAAQRIERAARVPESSGPTVALEAPDTRERSLGEMVTEDEGFQNFVRSGQAGNHSYQFNMERSLVDTTTTGAGNGGLWIPTNTPAAPVPITRRLFVRDLISRVQVSGNSMTYMQETNTATNELLATVVAEGVAKPEVALEWVQVTAPIRKIAAWIPLTTEIIEDAPALRGYIDNRLLYMLKLREEIEFLSGDGTGAHILGIREQTGLQTQDAVYEGATEGDPGDIPATVGLAIGKVENVDGTADGVAMHPLDHWEAVVQRHANTFDNGYGGNAPANASSITWGLPVVRTRGVERGIAIVADWRQGATALDRSAAQIDIGTQHASYFIENKVAVRAEERVGLAVDRPNFFVETEISFAVPGA